MGASHLFQSRRNPVYFIAEVGGNHEGDFQYALRLADLAIESGADAVKFQIYTGDSLVSRMESPTRNAHFKKFELTRTQYEGLAKRCSDAGVDFMASIWSVEQLAWADELVSVHKVGSGDLTAHPILRALAETNKPIVLSTGLSTMAEVTEAVRFLCEVNPAYRNRQMLGLLQCTSCYPTDDAEVNLAVIPSYKAAYEATVGFSDHSLGDTALLGAVALGAEILEKHFTDTRDGKSFRDHQISLTRDEVRVFLQKAHRLCAMRGSADKAPTAGEVSTGHAISFRRSVCAARDLAKGAILRRDDLAVLRPLHGVSAALIEQVVGKRLARDVSAYQALKAQDLLE